MPKLSGMTEICNYCRRSESTLLLWIRNMDFPAVKIGGLWESNTELIDQWFKQMIENGGTLPFKSKTPPKKPVKPKYR